ncbi:uncharacterized protein TM35_000621120 [Trypanosoma theileri]|uniref:Complement component 3 CUB domain-containing protein n=1 Tax=Trypanosoma theileri TaxID=67003 RepID=A0A1X0NGJ9_9TRYP|nr:uncharacterized protein TM35_000621120 [Trypanosoma theileri]ORC83638.1 hypothetical protein TM35_000621120 [Trypanosoma theileri]
MVMMRHVLCILALLLSCACVHVLAEEVPAADLSDQVPDTESETKVLLQRRDGDNCREGSGGSDDGDSCAEAAAPALGPGVGAKGPNTIGHDQSGGGLQHGPGGSALSSQASGLGSQVEVTTTNPTKHERENGERGAEGAAEGEVNSAGNGQGIQQQQESSQDSIRSEEATPGVKDNSISPPSPQPPQQTDDTSNDSSAVNTSAASGEGTGAQSSPTSASSQTDGTADGGNSAETSTNNSTSTNPETDNTSTNEEPTTTTTTTLPPELTNNKKGDADSSSSISSSVWVRVPLLFVVTLSCILVC